MLSTLLIIALAVFIALFGLTFLLHIFILRVPFVRTSTDVIDAMIRCARLEPGMRVLDLGAGDGSILIAAKRACPGISAIGYELVPTIWALGKLRMLCSGMKIEWRMRDALRADCSAASVIFLYVTPHLMRAFEEKFAKELKAGTRVISNTFRFPGREPQEMVTVKTWSGEKKVYLYDW